ELVIVKERWALENAIRKVETDVELQLGSRLTASRLATIRLRRQAAPGWPEPLSSGVTASAEIKEHRLPPASPPGWLTRNGVVDKSLDLEAQSEVRQATAKAEERSLKDQTLQSESSAPSDSTASNIQAEPQESDSWPANDQQAVSVAEANEAHRL